MKRTILIGVVFLVPLAFAAIVLQKFFEISMVVAAPLDALIRRWCFARCADPALGQPCRRGNAPAELQRRASMHSVKIGISDGPTSDPVGNNESGVWIALWFGRVGKDDGRAFL